MKPLSFAILACALTLASAVCAQAPATPEIREKQVTLKDGTSIRFLEAGRATAAPALVFIPGWTMPASVWKQQLRKFSSSRLAIAIDPRSQGDSTKTELGNTPEQRARDMREILAMLQIPRAALIGWSQGSQDVAAYVQQFGTVSIAAVAFVDSPVSAGPAEVEVNKEWTRQFLGMLAIYANYPAEYSAGMVRSTFKKPVPGLDLDEVIAHARKTPVNTGVTMLVMDIFGVDRRPALAKLDRPTLVIASAESPLLEAQKRMAAAIAGAELVIVEGAGHAVFVDQPDVFNQSLERLLKAAG